MKGEVLRGQLIHIDTDQGQIQVSNLANDDVDTIKIDLTTKLPAQFGWDILLGEYIEVVIVEGEARKVNLFDIF